jgi:DNA polymerase gamma 1
MLSRSLHEQIFKNCSFPPPDQSYVNISRDHLKLHGLDPAQSSTLPLTDFNLPTLQGKNLLEHFHRIGMSSAEPYRSMASEFAAKSLPPAPTVWTIEPGWIKYHHSDDGSVKCEAVSYPMHGGKPEQLLSFDVETMPRYHQYPIMACAGSPNAWYAWISPWLLDRSEDPEQLIPLGPSDIPRVVVGHNVSYDRARIQEEYHLGGSQNRFLDTMSLHVAVKGISSHQRPAWMKYRKQKDGELEKKREFMEAILILMDDVEAQLQQPKDEESREQLETLWENLQASIPKLHDSIESQEQELNPMPAQGDPEEEEGVTGPRWEDLTSANSLVHVAKLHCDIDISKEIRADLLKETPEHIHTNITDYLSYCASDVSVTHSVFQKVFPKFLMACPHPVSFAGIITMGSGFLPVNQEWEKYLENAENTYMTMERRVRDGLAQLAREAMEQNNGKEASEIDDVWLQQLDWTPKKAGKSRGIEELSAAPKDIDEKPYVSLGSSSHQRAY